MWRLCCYNVLSTYTKRLNKELPEPKSLHSSFWGKNFGSTLHWDMERILTTFGLRVERDSAKAVEDKIDCLERFVREGPTLIVIDLIDHGINPFLGRLFGHWIVLWGYDNGKREFYCYDSRKSDRNLPVGNCTYGYEKLLKLWKRDFIPQPFTHLYVRVKNK